MNTLRIEHPVNDYDLWKSAFDTFSEMRRAGGVRSHAISRPADDPKYVIADLGFDSTAEAEAFLGLLRTWVWTNSPALVGDPRTRILVTQEGDGPSVRDLESPAVRPTPPTGGVLRSRSPMTHTPPVAEWGGRGGRPGRR